MPRIRLTAGEHRFDFEVLEDAPRTAAWLATLLPFTGELQHSMWSGETCIAGLAGDAPPLETPMTSLYAGLLMVAPGADEGFTNAVLYVGYGSAELRGTRGRMFGTPVARLDGPTQTFRRALSAARRGTVAMTVSVEG